MKIIAALCMLIDHIGLIFFPWEIRLRLIGRLAMPIFAYGVARGAIYTSSLKRYMRKMLLFSFMSEIPFWLMVYEENGGQFEFLRLNVGFTFFFALSVIAALNYSGQQVAGEEKLNRFKSYVGGVASLGLIVVAELLQCDYGSYGVLMVLMNYLFLKRREKPSYIEMALGYVGLTVLFYYQSGIICWLQMAGVLAYAIIFATQRYSERKFSRFFYVFYPAHMFVLVMIKEWIG